MMERRRKDSLGFGLLGRSKRRKGDASLFIDLCRAVSRRRRNGEKTKESDGHGRREKTRVLKKRRRWVERRQEERA
ncbi:hypothetical protein Drorol1_Dr00009348 [Drosera rotundifolia]